MGLFFWSHFLGGQAGAVEIVLFLLGVGLLALEAFLIPGFGVAGFSGIALLLASLVMSFIPDTSSAPGVPGIPFDWGRLQVAIFTVLASFGGSIVGLLILARFIQRAPLFKHLVLAGATAGGGPGKTTAEAERSSGGLSGLVGKRGVAATDLRPAGKVEIEGSRMDAVTQAEFIDKGEPVEVTEAAGFRVVVARAGPSGHLVVPTDRAGAKQKRTGGSDDGKGGEG
jgi:membrane-bound serine protease (ClpP class)